MGVGADVEGCDTDGQSAAEVGAQAVTRLQLCAAVLVSGADLRSVAGDAKECERRETSCSAYPAPFPAPPAAAPTATAAAAESLPASMRCNGVESPARRPASCAPALLPLLGPPCIGPRPLVSPSEPFGPILANGRKELPFSVAETPPEEVPAKAAYDTAATLLGSIRRRRRRWLAKSRLSTRGYCTPSPEDLLYLLVTPGKVRKSHT